MTAATQIPLELPHRVALGGEDFFVSPSNRHAVDWVDRWPDWPGGLLLLTGPAGAGKSHLAAVWQAVAGAERRDPADIEEADVARLRAGSPLVVEGLGGNLSAECEVLLFHLVNSAREVGGSLLLTGREAPGHWPVALPDLASRLRAAAAARIAPPDESLMAALLVKQFSDRQLRVAADLVAYLVPRLERSFTVLREAVDRLDAAALAEQRAITIPFARKTLGL